MRHTRRTASASGGTGGAGLGVIGRLAAEGGGADLFLDPAAPVLAGLLDASGPPGPYNPPPPMNQTSDNSGSTR